MRGCSEASAEEQPVWCWSGLGVALFVAHQPGHANPDEPDGPLRIEALEQLQRRQADQVGLAVDWDRVRERV